MDGPEVKVIEVVGEGKTDIGSTLPNPGIELPTSGVVPILLHKLCGHPDSMRVKRVKFAFLQKGTLERKIQFHKNTVYNNKSVACVFVVDTEGKHPDVIEKLRSGRDARYPSVPTAVGVAHPCIEAWLLADPRAVARGIGINPLAEQPPDRPEDLPAPCDDEQNNPKVVLARCAGIQREVNAAEATKIATHIKDLDLIRIKCPLSFAPFADEVMARIRPIFAE